MEVGAGEEAVRGLGLLLGCGAALTDGRLSWDGFRLDELRPPACPPALKPAC